MSFPLVFHSFLRSEVRIASILPSPLEKTVFTFHQLHRYCRFFKATQLVNRHISSHNSNPIVYGTALDFIASQSTAISFGLNIALVIKCAEDILGEYKKLSDAYNTLQSAIACEFPPRVFVKEVGIHLPPPLFALKFRLLRAQKQITIIIKALAVFLKQIFHLSLALCDAELLCRNDPYMKLYACTELACKWSTYFDGLRRDLFVLNEELENRKELIERLLKTLNIPSGDLKKLEELKVIANEIAPYGRPIHEVAKDAMRSFYRTGKITPIDLSVDLPKKIPPGYSSRGPAWRGEAIDEKTLSSPMQEKAHPFFNSLLKLFRTSKK